MFVTNKTRWLEISGLEQYRLRMKKNLTVPRESLMFDCSYFNWPDLINDNKQARESRKYLVSEKFNSDIGRSMIIRAK